MVAASELHFLPIALPCLILGLALSAWAITTLRSMRRWREQAPDAVPSTARAWGEVLFVLLALVSFGATLCSGFFLLASI